jgi:hypothetical protein
MICDLQLDYFINRSVCTYRRAYPSSGLKKPQWNRTRTRKQVCERAGVVLRSPSFPSSRVENTKGEERSTKAAKILVS